MKIKAVSAAFALGLSAAVSVPVFAQHSSTYAGLERNDIKSLSPREVNSLLAGQGMGYARAAELNGYPGPMHVLELADQLALTTDQLQSTRRLMTEHKARARDLGAEVVSAERALDRLFSERQADAAAVASAAERVSALQARLRAEHLNTHLAQTALLNAEQIRRYSELRGYATTAGSKSHHPLSPR